MHDWDDPWDDHGDAQGIDQRGTHPLEAADGEVPFSKLYLEALNLYKEGFM